MSGHANLLLDVGNTNIKYAWYRQSQHIADLQVMRTTLESLPDLLLQASMCMFCCVGKESIASAIHKQCELHNVLVHRVITPAEQFGISNAYNTPANMGTDRWMAIVAGGALSSRNFVVIDAGTAITCDFVVNHKHIGGWIAPGLHMARAAVVNNTQKVFDNNGQTNELAAGNDTPNCVAYGVVAQLTGMLSQAKLLMLQHDNAFDVYISGGDAVTILQAEQSLIDDLAKKLKNNRILSTNLGTTNYLENLVLVGLARLVNENYVTDD